MRSPWTQTAVLFLNPQWTVGGWGLGGGGQMGVQITFSTSEATLPSVANDTARFALMDISYQVNDLSLWASGDTLVCALGPGTYRCYDPGEVQLLSSQKDKRFNSTYQHGLTLCTVPLKIQDLLSQLIKILKRLKRKRYLFLVHLKLSQIISLLNHRSKFCSKSYFQSCGICECLCF